MTGRCWQQILREGSCVRRTVSSLALTCLLILLLSSPALTATGYPVEAISLEHLNALKAWIETPQGPLPIWYVYAEPTAAGYRPVPAAGEGVACVDDVARALLVYLEHYELTGDAASLDHARDAIAFLAYTRQEDGTYANFVMADGRLNLTGVTSRPGVNWWMARAMWGLAKAVQVFKTVDPEEAREIATLLKPSVEKLKDVVKRAQPGGRLRFAVSGSEPAATPAQALVEPAPANPQPAPVIAGGGADVSAIFLLAISLLHSAQPDPELEALATALALGLRKAQQGDAATPPYRAVMPSPGSSAVWTGWGSHGMEALGLAGIVFDRPEWVIWAAETAHALGTYIVAGPGALAAQGPAPIPYPQIAYDQSPLVRGLVYLHHATGRPLYSDLALLAASWLFGNNPALEPLHHGPSGRTFDGVDGDAWGARGRVNYNAGAESTIEGLSMLLALARLKPNGLLQDPRLAQPAAHGPLVLEAESYLKPGFGRIETRRERALAGSRPSGDGYIVMHPGAEASLPLPAPLPAGTYRLDLVHGGARIQAATVYVLAGEKLIATLEIGRDAQGDRLRLSRLGLVELGDPRPAIRLVVDGGPLALDGIVVHPAVMWRKARQVQREVVAFRNMTEETQHWALPFAGPGEVQLSLYDEEGAPVAVEWIDDTTVRVPPLGFGIAVR